MRTYFDSSALVKLLINEPGRPWALACWSDASARFTSRLSYVEVRAALGAATRARRLSDSALLIARDEFEQLWRRVEITEAAPFLVNDAADLAERHGLRGYDSVHLASAIEVRDSEPIHMLTWDRDLADAAYASGVNVIRTRDT